MSWHLIKRRNKYGAKRAKSNHFKDRSFDSTAERDRANQLRMLEMAGEISDLICQPQISLSEAAIGYKPDFSYIEDGRVIYEDVKGVETEGFHIKKRLWSKYGPGLLRVTKRKGCKFVVTETIYPPVKTEDQ